MTVDKLERVLLRLRRMIGPGKNRATVVQLRRCIMLEIGIDPRTYQVAKTALVRLKWLKRDGNTHVILTNNDLTGDY